MAGGRFRPERPPRPGKSFGRFWPVSGPRRPQNFSKSPRPLQKPVNCEFSENELGETTQCRPSKKVAQCERGSGEAKKFLKTGQWRRTGFVSWVPNQQNRSPADETAPPPKKKAISRVPGIRGTPNRVHRFCIYHAIKFGRRAFRPERAPQPGKSTFWRFWPVFGPKKSPDPSKNHPILSE